MNHDDIQDAGLRDVPPGADSERPPSTPVYVEIVEHGTDDVVKRMGPMDRRKAERVEDGASINLNHERFYTRTVSR